MVKLIFGCGYLGTRVAQRWIAAGDQVWAMTRSQHRASDLQRSGIRPIVTDITRECIVPVELKGVATVLFAVGFDRTPSQTVESVYGSALENVLTALAREEPPSRFVYISSTGVYGQADGDWVDEASPCLPTRAGGRACLAAEQRLTTSALGSRRIILRMAGLYGPGRIPKLAAIRHGEPIPSPETGYLNLIHIEDAADIVVEVEQRVEPPKTIVVSDGNPVLRAEFYRQLARLVGSSPPQFAYPAEGRGNERASSDKRVNNRLLREILDRQLRYPSYREGLAAIVAEER